MPLLLNLYQQIEVDFSKNIFSIGITAINLFIPYEINYVFVHIRGSDTEFRHIFVSNLCLHRLKFWPVSSDGKRHWRTIEDTIRSGEYENEDAEAITQEVKSLIYGHIQ